MTELGNRFLNADLYFKSLAEPTVFCFGNGCPICSMFTECGMMFAQEENVVDVLK